MIKKKRKRLRERDPNREFENVEFRYREGDTLYREMRGSLGHFWGIE